MSIAPDLLQYGQVEIGEGAIIQDHVVIGKPPQRAKISLYAQVGTQQDEFGPTIIGNYVTMCCGTIVYAGAKLGNNVFLGDYASIRENTTVGEGTIIGRNVTVECYTQIGKNCKIQTGAHITGYCKIGDGVFVGPEVCTTNDKYMSVVDVPMVGPVIEDGALIGANVTILPSVRIGKKSVISAGSVVVKDVPDEQLWMGNPAKKISTYNQFIGAAKMFSARVKKGN
jgi:acetyltransferase-like isoleucine patch superfamily enzyme